MSWQIGLAFAAVFVVVAGILWWAFADEVSGDLDYVLTAPCPPVMDAVEHARDCESCRTALLHSLDIAAWETELGGAA